MHDSDATFTLSTTLSPKRLQSLDQGMTELSFCNGADSKKKGEVIWQMEP